MSTTDPAAAAERDRRDRGARRHTSRGGAPAGPAPAAVPAPQARPRARRRLRTAATAGDIYTVTVDERVDSPRPPTAARRPSGPHGPAVPGRPAAAAPGRPSCRRPGTAGPRGRPGVGRARGPRRAARLAACWASSPSPSGTSRGTGACSATGCASATRGADGADGARGRCTAGRASCTGRRPRRRPPTTSWPGCASGRAVAWTARPLGVVPGLPLALTEDLGSSRDPVPARSGLDVVHPGSERGARGGPRGPPGRSPSCTPAASTPRDLSRAHGRRRGRQGGQARPAARAVRPRARRRWSGGSPTRLCAALAGLPHGTSCARRTGATSPASCWSGTAPCSSSTSTSSAWPTPPSTSGTSWPTCGRPGSGTTGPGRRAWFDAAARRLPHRRTCDRLAERGESAATCAGIAGRAPVFEAALLLKIAARRANRLHSPRPGEVAAVLDEVAALARVRGRGTAVRSPTRQVQHRERAVVQVADVTHGCRWAGRPWTWARAGGDRRRHGRGSASMTETVLSALLVM